MPNPPNESLIVEFVGQDRFLSYGSVGAIRLHIIRNMEREQCKWDKNKKIQNQTMDLENAFLSLEKRFLNKGGCNYWK